MDRDTDTLPEPGSPRMYTYFAEVVNIPCENLLIDDQDSIGFELEKGVQI